MKIEKMPNQTHFLAGRYLGKNPCWFPFLPFVVPGSFEVRPPTLNHPYSYLRHFYTVKYAKLLYECKPYLYEELATLPVQKKLLFAATNSTIFLMDKWMVTRPYHDYKKGKEQPF